MTWWHKPASPVGGDTKNVPTEEKADTNGDTLAAMFLSWDFFFWFPIKTLVFLKFKNLLVGGRNAVRTWFPFYSHQQTHGKELQTSWTHTCTQRHTCTHAELSWIIWWWHLEFISYILSLLKSPCLWREVSNLRLHRWQRSNAPSCGKTVHLSFRWIQCPRRW